ncbi:hypothetical protein HanRHA438_Chr17g0790901 [Helianthus annuus]|nr:hypothetical protein HanRHA438_Chr17g0790901 [Helianthus annuus]
MASRRMIRCHVAKLSDLCGFMVLPSVFEEVVSDSCVVFSGPVPSHSSDESESDDSLSLLQAISFPSPTSSSLTLSV